VIRYGPLLAPALAVVALPISVAEPSLLGAGIGAPRAPAALNAGGIAAGIAVLVISVAAEAQHDERLTARANELPARGLRCFSTIGAGRRTRAA
jgi:hypothetical protein